MTTKLTKPKKKQLVTPSKKLTPASICAQKSWSKLAKPLKKELRKTLPDKDRDGVPNGFDCKPKNRRRQEGFLSQDARYLSTNPKIELGKRVGEGMSGTVYAVKGNDTLVIKVPLGFVNDGRYDQDTRYAYIDDNAKDLDEEITTYNNHNLENEPLFIPTKVVNIGKSDISDRNFVGLVRPIVKVADKRTSQYQLSDTEIELLRRKVISISHRGFIIGDGLQVGIDDAGRPLLYDLGYLTRGTPSQAFIANADTWKFFLRKLGKWADTYRDKDSLKNCLAKYDTINPNER